MTAREHAEQAVAFLELKLNGAVPAAQAHALTAIALALTESSVDDVINRGRLALMGTALGGTA